MTPEEQAKAEIAEEDFRARVEAAKARLRHRSPWWRLPFTITISKRKD